MSKRKASFESITESEEGPTGQGVAQADHPASLSQALADIAPATQMGRGRVPGKPKGPEPTIEIRASTSVAIPTGQVNQLVPELASLAVAERHVIPPGIPAGPVGGLTTLLAEVEDPAARWFWSLLHDAGYEIW